MKDKRKKDNIFEYEKGKALVIAIITVLLANDLVNFIISSASFAFGALLILVYDIFELALISTILLFLYKGHRWAKWITSILLFLYAIYGFIKYPVSLFLIAGILMVTLAVSIIVSKDIKIFLESQRAKHKKKKK